MGKGKGGKGKDRRDYDWHKGKGVKGYGERFRSDGPPASAPLLAVPQLAAGDASWCQEVTGGLHAFDRGHVLFSAKELYFEVQGQCSVHLAVPAPTKINQKDTEAFANSGPVELAGRSFGNLQELRAEIISLRKAHSDPPRRLRPEAERLMRGVFQHHPQAEGKLRDVQFIQVAPNPQSSDPTDVTFFVMRNEQDGDDISYVKCLRAMAEQKEGEQMLPLATLTNNQNGLSLRMASADMPMGPLPTPGILGVRVDLAKPSLFIHCALGVQGPWPLKVSGHHSGLPHVPLRVVVQVPEQELVVLRWAAPFDVKEVKRPEAEELQLALPALEDQGPKPADLKKYLEALMKDQAIPGDLSSLSVDELLRIALQVLVKSLDESLHVTRSDTACAAQNQSLLRIAREQGTELLCQQLLEARAELQQLKRQLSASEATLQQLREEMAAARRRAGAEAMGGDHPAPAVAERGAPAPVAAAAAPVESAQRELELLGQQLRQELPHCAGQMLRNSLRLMSSEMYSGPTRALWELLQNADDCSYVEDAEIRFEKTGDDLWIEYNEQGFTSEDMKALCSLGSSTKGLQQTGEKGVGFKSAFVLSAKPHILSNPYRFFFDENAQCPLPQVTPHGLDRGAVAALPRPVPDKGTAVYLPLRSDFPELMDEIVPESLLFLRRLRHITVGAQSYARRDGAEGRCTVVTQGADGNSQELEYIIAQGPDVAIAFPLGASSAGALLLATLPIHRLEGLKTPLNAAFELTANREALRENSRRNVKLRDDLAELFLQAAEEHPILGSKVWQLQPELAEGFWAPFAQRVRTGLQEVPLIPGAGAPRRWALKCCRRPGSKLLLDLGLGPEELKIVGLAIPTEDFLRQLPSDCEFCLPEFDAKDLIGLLQCEDFSGTWRSYGNPWRQKVVAALLQRLSELDLSALRLVALFPVADGDWSACDDGHIYLGLPDGAPSGLLKVLHAPSACPADRELLRSMGHGVMATSRDVAYAIVQRALGLATVEDRRFSWTNLAYLGEHWADILQSGAVDDWLSKQSAEQMAELLRSIALPSCSGRLQHCAKELQCPFLLGCKSAARDRSKLLAEPPGANDTQARLRWELTFLRLGAVMADDWQLQLPSNFFAEAGMGKELEALLDHYEQLGVLSEISQRCSIPDRRDRPCHFGQLLGPEFQAMLGPDFVLHLCSDGVVARCAVRLLDVVLKPSALLVVQHLPRAARGGTETLRCAYTFLSAEWREGRFGEEPANVLKDHGVWMLNCEGDLSLQEVSSVTWEDVQRQISLWPKDGLDGIFLALGVSPDAPPAPAAEVAVAPEVAAAATPAGGATNNQNQRPAPSGAPPSQPLTWPVMPQVREADGEPEASNGLPSAGAGGGTRPFPELSGAQLPLLGKLLNQIFHSTGGDGVLYGQTSTKEMLASEVHFTQNSISKKFGHGVLQGREVSDVAKALREGRMKASDLPLVVVKFESKYFTLNNRSLYALRKASTAQQPFKAQVAAFEKMCPVTAKFIQLRCHSLAEKEESAQRSKNSSADGRGSQQV